jgi:hypothetical protein
MGKEIGALSAGTYGLPSEVYNGKYTSPCWIQFLWKDYPDGQGWKMFRNAPAWTAGFGFDYYDDYSDCSNFGYISYHKTMDDLTGQLPDGDADTEYLVEFPRWNNECPAPTTVQGVSATAGVAYLTQNYVVTRGYRISKLKSGSPADNFPLGTILKHTSTTELGDKITATDEALEQTIGIFEVIKTTQKPCKVDIAHGVPTVIYDIPTEEGINSEDFSASMINEIDSFYTHAEAKPVYESRTINLVNPPSFPTVSGTFTAEDYERYIAISNREGILASEYDLSTPWVNMVTVASGVAISGLISHFETTNYVPEGTYIFYTVSGTKSFFQKNPDEGFWRDYTTGLPESAITIIRVDDMI